MSPEAFVERIRAALGRRPGDGVAAKPALDLEAARVGDDGLSRSELVDRFARQARAVGASVTVVEAAGVDAALMALDGEDTAVTPVAVALAATGSIVIEADAETARNASLWPARHVAVVRAQQIVDDLIDWLPGAGSGPQPSARVIITGPSKTADIEGILVTGVHGPKELHIVVAV